MSRKNDEIALQALGMTMADFAEWCGLKGKDFREKASFEAFCRACLRYQVIKKEGALVCVKR